MFTIEQLDALQAAAEAATPGPWTADCCPAANMVYGPSDSIGVDAVRADAEFIAAANPAVILEFVGAHREVVRQRDDVAKRLSEYLDDSTGGQLSKPWYPVSVMVEDTKAHYAEMAESDHSDGCENKEALDAALARIARVEAVLMVLDDGGKSGVSQHSKSAAAAFAHRRLAEAVRAALTEGEPDAI